MKQTFLTLAAALLISGAALAQDKGKDKSCCNKDSKACKEQTAQKKACCMQPSKTASLRAAAAKPAKPATAAKPAGK
jgi:hypothetical protein